MHFQQCNRAKLPDENTIRDLKTAGHNPYRVQITFQSMDYLFDATNQDSYFDNSLRFAHNTMFET